MHSHHSKFLLTTYDPNLHLGLACDASSVRVGALLFHTNPDDSEQPTYSLCLKSFTSAEKNYSQIEQEALSIIFGVRKFLQLFYARSFLLLTDHKPGNDSHDGCQQTPEMGNYLFSIYIQACQTTWQC